MSKPVRFGTAISMVALATAIGGCAAPQHHASSASVADSQVGAATRALAALSSGDAATAVTFAEQAVERTPGDAGFRTLLGSSYFAAGRFASAEAAFKDSLSLDSNQPQVVLKLALAQIAQGRNAEANAVLDANRSQLDAADYGLAIALAGRSAEAVAALEPAARVEGADARVRQNLALAYAFQGDWASARTIAGQDVPADQLDARIHQWMQLANPAKPSDQVAALIGVSPAAADPGQPVRLALNSGNGPRLAAAAPVAVSAAEQPVQVAEAVPPPVPPLMQAAPGDAPVAEAQAAPAFTPEVTAPPPPPVARAARVVHAKLPKPTVRTGNSGAVVQIGAYSNASRVAAAWNAAAHRYGALRNYTPMSAKFATAKGTFYRLSVKGFGSVSEANALCASVRRGGGSCFVRKFAGDAPVQLASR